MDDEQWNRFEEQVLNEVKNKLETLKENYPKLTPDMVQQRLSGIPSFASISYYGHLQEYLTRSKNHV